jgi:hypothetical protein
LQEFKLAPLPKICIPIDPTFIKTQLGVYVFFQPLIESGLMPLGKCPIALIRTFGKVLRITAPSPIAFPARQLALSPKRDAKRATGDLPPCGGTLSAVSCSC